MTNRRERNQQFLTNLFTGRARRHGIIFQAEQAWPPPELGDYSIATRPVKEWVPYAVRSYELRRQWLADLDHDDLPTAGQLTNTGIFAAAFGCRLHRHEGSPASATPLVRTAAEADRLTVPDLWKSPTLARVFELNQAIRDALGPDVPLTVPDIQSPFDIAALIWRKEEMFVAMVENPAAMHRLVAKTHELLTNSLLVFKREFPNGNLIHHPPFWAPPELGCSLSEDEIGSLSVAMFEEFCLPSLTDLSRTFGGMFLVTVHGLSAGQAYLGPDFGREVYPPGARRKPSREGTFGGGCGHTLWGQAAPSRVSPAAFIDSKRRGPTEDGHTPGDVEEVGECCRRVGTSPRGATGKPRPVRPGPY